jgi:hypothetical protein
MAGTLTLIHVRFGNNGSVVEIGERPNNLSAQEWFSVLSTKTSNAYQTLAGGRGVFRIAREMVDELKAAVLQ